MIDDVIVVGVMSDDPLAGDIAHQMGQETEISDLVSYKDFANTEFCPRFMCDESDFEHIGHSLDGKTVVIVSSCSGSITRNASAMRNFLMARAAKDNGAKRVVLIEPDLFYSAQDRGPRPEYGRVAFKRDLKDYKKFDGQPFSSNLYAELLSTAGVDAVMTVHNHSMSVQDIFNRKFYGNFYNLSPARLYANFLAQQETIMSPEESQKGYVVCAPDKGAMPFVKEVFGYLCDYAKEVNLPVMPQLLLMNKERLGERKVIIEAHKDSPTRLEDIAGKEVIVFDDMVRTGNTIVECCKHLKECGAKRVLFVVTHFYSSQEVKENLNNPAIDEIITTNTLPNILNRDMQGRLRRKMLVLKLERWIVTALMKNILGLAPIPHKCEYTIDISRKNDRWERTREIQD